MPPIPIAQPLDAQREYEALAEKAARLSLSLDAVGKAADAARDRLKRMASEGGKGVDDLNAKSKKLADPWKDFGKALEGGLAKAVASLTGFVTAGLAASNEGRVFALQMKEISFQIASAFAPSITAVQEQLGNLVNFLQTMSGDQQRTIQLFGEGAAAALLFGRALSLIGVSLGPWGILLQLIVGVAAGTERGRDALGKLADAFGTLLEAAQPIIQAIVEELGTLAESLAEIINLVAEAVKWFAELNKSTGGRLLSYAMNPAKALLEDLGVLDKGEQAGGKGGPTAGRRGSDRERQELTRASTSGPARVEDLYLRFQQAALQQDSLIGLGKRQLKELEKIAANTGGKESGYDTGGADFGPNDEGYDTGGADFG